MFGAKRLWLNRELIHGWSQLTPNIRLVFSPQSSVCHHSLTTEDRRLTAESGGADRDRTGGLLVANQALSQLSYSPDPVAGCRDRLRVLLTTGHSSLATDFWWAWVELNYRPHPYQGCALAT